MTIEEKVKELEEAKKNVLAIVNEDCLIDMKGLVYWAGRVESLRQLIINSL